MASTRRLTAILAADVAGYSRLMGADEELKAHLRSGPPARRYSGKGHTSQKHSNLCENASFSAGVDSFWRVNSLEIVGMHQY
jgi:hypothetical protein